MAIGLLSSKGSRYGDLTIGLLSSNRSRYSDLAIGLLSGNRGRGSNLTVSGLLCCREGSEGDEEEVLEGRHFESGVCGCLRVEKWYYGLLLCRNNKFYSRTDQKRMWFDIDFAVEKRDGLMDECKVGDKKKREECERGNACLSIKRTAQ